MKRVEFYYYHSSPRIHISKVIEMDFIPSLGDIVTLINDECNQLNKKIKDKNFILHFKVIEREYRMISRYTFFSDVRIKLEPINIIESEVGNG